MADVVKKKEKTQKVANVVSDRNKPMLGLLGMGRDGDRMEVRGSLMGAWPTKFYMEPEHVVTAIGIMLNWQVIGYVLALPFIIARRKRERKKAAKAATTAS